MSVEVREVDPTCEQDRRHVLALRRRWTEEQAGHEVDDDSFEMRFDEWFRREADQRVTWLALADDEPIGMTNMLVFTRMPRPEDAAESRPRQWGYVANVFVREGRRDGGVGARLVEACTAYADQHGFARLVLAPSPRSVGLYERHGFGAATQLMVRPGR